MKIYDKYAHDVCSGEILAGEWVVRACQRHLDELEKQDDADFLWKFDAALAERPIKFIQQLPHVKGKWASKGQKLELEPWQQFIIASIFGWIRKSDGIRRYREAYIEVPRKNGKSVLGAGIGNFMLVADNEFGSEVYSGATTEKQAWEVFRPAKLMATRTPALLQHYDLEVNASNMVRMQDFSKFEPLIGNPGDGASPHCAIVDEYHEHANSDLYDTMQTGMGARENPLMLVITTAGSNLGGPCYEKRLEGQKVLNGTLKDDRQFIIIYSLDEGDDFKDRKNWHKANPNLGISVSEDFLEAQVQAAVRSPSKQNTVKTKHFNQWVGARTAWLNMEEWNQCGDAGLDLADFVELDCMVGLDLATRIDIAARGSLFWKDTSEGRHYYWFPHFYVPETALENAKNAKIYEGWAAGGHMEIMDGAEVDFLQVQEDILALPDLHGVRELVYDPWQATQLAQAVRQEGLEAVEYRNTVGNMSPPMRELEAAIASRRFHHNHNPVMNWMASNVVSREDNKSNIFPVKERDESKIDGVVALLFAMGRAMVAEDQGSFDDFLNNVVRIS